jgi:hypothetical protein
LRLDTLNALHPSRDALHASRVLLSLSAARVAATLETDNHAVCRLA